MSTRPHEIRIAPLPAWLDAERLLGPELFTFHILDSGAREAVATLTGSAAAEIAARLRGLGFDGTPLEITVSPPLPRTLVRAARLDEARLRRDRSEGFARPGVRLDEEGRFSLTPERLALELGKRANGLSVLDVCCGSGGNSIGFARAGSAVQAIELDARRAADARHNAGVYGVGERVTVRQGDAREILPSLKADIVFIDPPWGKDYDKKAVALSDLTLLDALLPLCRRFARVWIKLPPSFDTRSIPAARVEAVFGAAKGDARRVKFLLLRIEM